MHYKYIRFDEDCLTKFGFDSRWFEYLKLVTMFIIETTGDAIENNASNVDYETTKQDWQNNGCRLYTNKGYIKFDDIAGLLVRTVNELPHWVTDHTDLEDYFYDEFNKSNK